MPWSEARVLVIKDLSRMGKTIYPSLLTNVLILILMSTESALLRGKQIIYYLMELDTGRFELV